MSPFGKRNIYSAMVCQKYIMMFFICLLVFFFFFFQILWREVSQLTDYLKSQEILDFDF